MQTFLPYSDFKKSVQSLDYKRLGKQRVEARQVYDIVSGAKNNGWRNHPAVKMWHGHVDALALYHDACILEWIKRGYNNSMPLLILETDDDGTNPVSFIVPHKITMPWWMGDDNMHRSHRSRLIAKLEDHYLPLFPDD